MELSVIILNHNGKRWLKDCFQSIFENTRGINFEIILVDNASTDGSVEYVRKEFSEVKVVSNGENLGFTRGNNIGLREARGEYVCILNNDTVVLRDALNNLYNFIKSQTKKTIATGKIFTFSGEIQPNCGNLPSFLQEYFNFSFSKIRGPNPFNIKVKGDEVQEVGLVTGTFFMIKRDDMLELCGFDENIVIFYEDADLCLRFKKMGGQAMYYPDSVIKHYWGGYYRTYSFEGLRISYKSILYYFHKHYGRLYSCFFNISVKFTALLIIGVLSIMTVITLGFLKKVLEKNKLFLAILRA